MFVKDSQKIFFIKQGLEKLTTSQGCPVGDKTNVRTVGEHGPVSLDDFVFLDEISHFDRERIPERVVHAKGAGERLYIIHVNHNMYVGQVTMSLC